MILGTGGVDAMAQHNEVLIGAIRKLAVAGEKAGFTVEEMIELLNTGVSVETLLNLICFRLQMDDFVAEPKKAQGQRWSL